MEYLVLWNYISTQSVVRFASLTHVVTSGEARHIAGTIYKDNAGSPITYKDMDRFPLPVQVIPLELVQGDCILHWKHYDENDRVVRHSTQRVSLGGNIEWLRNLITSNESTQMRTGEDSNYKVCIQISPL